MKARLKPLVIGLCLTGCMAAPAFAAVQSASNTDYQQLSVQTKALEANLALMQQQMTSLKQQLKSSKKMASSSSSAAAPTATSSQVYTGHPTGYPTGAVSSSALVSLISQEKEYLPFDLDVPGQAFVSTGPYVGVHYQYAGGDLIVNTPSINNDMQLLSIRKSIMDQLAVMGGLVKREPYHSHLLLSGVLEAQAGYLALGGQPSTSNIDVTNMSLDSFFIGPSDWMLGFIELTYDSSSPLNSVYTSTSNYTVANSRVLVNKAFMTFGDFQVSPFYATIGQYYVPFGAYSSVMISDPLTKLLTRTKGRAFLVGMDQQSPDAIYASAYIFRGDSHAASVDKINNGGINLGYKFALDKFSGNMGAGVIGNIADSGGMQVGTGFQNFEQIVHRVPGYNARGNFDYNGKIDVIMEYVGASTSFNPNDMSFNNHGAKPWAIDGEAAYSFPILDGKPSSVAFEYTASGQALAMGIPLNRYGLAFNTSLVRNTLEAIEFRRDREYAASAVANGAGDVVSPQASGKIDRAITASIDYYF